MLVKLTPADQRWQWLNHGVQAERRDQRTASGGHIRGTWKYIWKSIENTLKY